MKPNSCFVNNYFGVGLKVWLANMVMQSVFNEYEALTYTCHYL